MYLLFFDRLYEIEIKFDKLFRLVKDFVKLN